MVAPQNPRDGTIGQYSTFPEHGHVAYQIKWNHESNMVANILSVDPPTHTYTLAFTGSIGQSSAFSEHGHVAYPIKCNHEMQQHGSNYFACRPPCP